MKYSKYGDRDEKGRLLPSNKPPKKAMKVTDAERELILRLRQEKDHGGTADE